MTISVISSAETLKLIKPVRPWSTSATPTNMYMSAFPER